MIHSKPSGKNYVLYSLVIISAVYLFSFQYYKPWRGGIIGGGDSWGYYLYLPALFIHHDIDSLDKSLAARKKYHPGFFSAHQSANPLGIEEAHVSKIGKQVDKYTMGMSFLYFPFFALAHLLAKLFALPADGYSIVYIYLVHLSSICYAILGLFLLSRVLSRFVSNPIAAITISIIALGTNLYYFCVMNSPMAHSYLFFLYALLIYLTQRWYDKRQLHIALGIGLVSGLVTLIRPSEIICILIPLLWDIRSLAEVSGRIRLLSTHKPALMLAIAGFISVMIPQMIYWKFTGGEFLYYSYDKEGFNFLHPNLFWGLFQFKNGWLAYTPVMGLALIGIVISLKKARTFVAPLLAFLPLHIYVTYSWWCWNYVNGFGSRPMVETYALLGLPLAVITAEALSRKWLKFFFLALVVFFTWLNLFNTFQFSRGILWSEDANWEYYKRIFGKTSIDRTDLVVYDSGEKQPNIQKLSLADTLYHNSFEDSLSDNYFSNGAYDGNYSFRLNQNMEFSPGYAQAFEMLQARPGDWLKCSVRCMRTYEGNDIYRMSSLVVKIGETKKWRHVRLDNKPGNTENSLWGGRSNIWEPVDLWVRIPNNIAPDDTVRCFVWNTTPNYIYIDELTLELWTRR